MTDSPEREVTRGGSEPGRLRAFCRPIAWFLPVLVVLRRATGRGCCDSEVRIIVDRSSFLPPPPIHPTPDPTCGFPGVPSALRGTLVTADYNLGSSTWAPPRPANTSTSHHRWQHWHRWAHAYIRAARRDGWMIVIDEWEIMWLNAPEQERSRQRGSQTSGQYAGWKTWGSSLVGAFWDLGFWVLSISVFS